jgi:hypothetical protein
VEDVVLIPWFQAGFPEALDALLHLEGPVAPFFSDNFEVLGDTIFIFGHILVSLSTVVGVKSQVNARLVAYSNGSLQSRMASVSVFFTFGFQVNSVFTGGLVEVDARLFELGGTSRGHVVVILGCRNQAQVSPAIIGTVSVDVVYLLSGKVRHLACHPEKG